MIYLLYSQSQKAYHRSTQEEMIEENLVQLKNNIQSDWIVVAIADNDEEAYLNFPLIRNTLGRL